jgi:small subunit ribosomal protein S5
MPHYYITGKENIQWPGLSAPIIRGKEIIQRQKLPKDEKYQESLLKMRERVFKMKKQKISPIDRGWTGGHPEGRKIGPPDPVGESK